MFSSSTGLPIFPGLFIFVSDTTPIGPTVPTPFAVIPTPRVKAVTSFLRFTRHLVSLRLRSARHDDGELRVLLLLFLFV